MLERLKLLLKINSEEGGSDDSDDPLHQTNQLDHVIQDLEAAIQTVKRQYQRIHIQEKEIIEKLKGYYEQYESKLKKAKKAFAEKNEIEAEGFFKESEIINHQIKQYKKIASDVQATKQKLMSQESKFTFTRDQLLSKKTLGEAQVDATQLNADLSEQLMFLNESSELTKFDELIEEATYKSQAIEEIQGVESTLDNYLEETSPAINNLEKLIEKEHADKVATSIKNQQVLFEQVFGKLSPIETQVEDNRKKKLLEELKSSAIPQDDKEDTVKGFFQEQEEKSLADQKEDEAANDRIKSFFQNEDPKEKEDKKSVIKHFFNNK